MRFGKLVQPVDNLDGQLTDRRIRDILLMHRGVNIDRRFQRNLPCRLTLIRKIFSTPSLPMRLRKCNNSVLCDMAILFDTHTDHKKPGSEPPRVYRRLYFLRG
jgi:hypothetical protein